MTFYHSVSGNCDISMACVPCRGPTGQSLCWNERKVILHSWKLKSINRRRHDLINCNTDLTKKIFKKRWISVEPLSSKQKAGRTVRAACQLSTFTFPHTSSCNSPVRYKQEWSWKMKLIKNSVDMCIQHSLKSWLVSRLANARANGYDATLSQ